MNNLSAKIESGFQTLAYSCPEPPEITRVQAWCRIAGRFRAKEHSLAERTLHEMVLIYCVAGNGWFELEGCRHRIAANDIFFCPANRSHGYGCDTENGWDVWWVHFAGTHAEALCRAAGLTVRTPVLPLGDQPGLIARFSQLLEGLGKPSPDTPWVAADALHALLTVLVRVAQSGNQPVNLAMLVDSTVKSLDELVARSGYSKYHFCRLFKKETGRSPWQVVMEHKLERARELLLGTRLSIKEISAELGFQNADYFARCFVRHTGITPRDYRGRRRSGQ